MAIDQPDQRQLVEEAALWIVQLSSDDESTRHHAQLKFNQWKQRSQHHQKIAADIEQCIHSIQIVSQATPDKKLVKSALKAGLGSSKTYKYLRAGSVFSLALFAFSCGILFLTNYSVAYLTADIQGNTAQWTDQTLADGSRLILRGKSAVNIDFQGKQRVVELVQGQIYIDVAKDPHRPLIVKTPHGQIQALGTAFSVDYSTEATQLKMLHSRVRVHAANGYSQPSVIVNAGQAVSLNQHGIQALSTVNIYNEQQKWQKHQLMVENLPLDQVLKQLDQNYKGKILFNSAALHKIQVNAVFPEIEMYQITPYLVVVTTKNTR